MVETEIRKYGQARGCSGYRTVTLLSAIPLLPATWFMWHDGGFYLSITIISTSLIIASLSGGVAGLIAFSKRHNPTGLATSAAAPRIAGDGTHIPSMIVLILQIGKTIALMNSGIQGEGQERDLRFARCLESWIQ